MARMGRLEVHRAFGGETEGKRPIGRPRHKWEHHINMDLQEVNWGAWTGLIRLRIDKVGGPL